MQTPRELKALIEAERTGVILSSVDELGRLEFTAIADTAAGAEALYTRVQRTLIAAARARAAGIAAVGRRRERRPRRVAAL